MLVRGILVPVPDMESWDFWNDTPLCVSSNITIIKEPVKKKKNRYKKKSKILNLKNNTSDLFYINEKIEKPKEAYRNSR